jgi:hypothetical protein
MRSKRKYPWRRPLISPLLVYDIPGNLTNKIKHLPTLVVTRCVNTQRLPLNGECKGHRHVLKSHGHLPDTKVKNVRLQPPTIDKRGDRRRVHVRCRPDDHMDEWEES